MNGTSLTPMHSPNLVQIAESRIQPFRSARTGPTILRAVESLLSPHKDAQSTKRIPEGHVYAEIPLEAAKAYPIRLFDGIGLPIKIAYADWNTKKELNKLAIKLEKGGKTAAHPQIALFVKGPYHIENLLYSQSDPREWATWMELYLDPRNMNLDNLIDSLLRIKLALEGIKC